MLNIVIPIAIAYYMRFRDFNKGLWFTLFATIIAGFLSIWGKISLNNNAQTDFTMTGDEIIDNIMFAKFGYIFYRLQVF